MMGGNEVIDKHRKDRRGTKRGESSGRLREGWGGRGVCVCVCVCVDSLRKHGRDRVDSPQQAQNVDVRKQGPASEIGDPAGHLRGVAHLAGEDGRDRLGHPKVRNA